MLVLSAKLDRCVLVAPLLSFGSGPSLLPVLGIIKFDLLHTLSALKLGRRYKDKMK